MLTKSILKIWWLLSVNFEKFTSINLWTSRNFKRWTVYEFIKVNFSKLTNNNQIFRNDFDYIHYHLCKILSQIIEWTFFLSIVSLK